MSLSYSPLKTKNPYPESFRSPKTKSSRLPKAFVRAVRKDEIQSFNVDSQKAAIAVASHLVPEGLIESSKSKHQWGEMNRKVKYVRTLLTDNYDSYTFNIYQELSVINKVPPVVVRNDEWTWDEACYYLYEERAFDNIVISPGPGSPMRPADVGLCLQLLLKCRDIPILGVCLGPQVQTYTRDRMWV